MTYIAIFGEHNATAFAELKITLKNEYPKLKITHIEKTFALFETSKTDKEFDYKSMQFKLANSLKIGKLLFTKNNFHSFLSTLKEKTIPLEITDKHNIFSVSIYGLKNNKMHSVHKSCTNTLKQNFLKQGLKTKYFEKKDSINSTPAEVFLKNLIGREMLVCKISNKYSAFKLVASLNPFHYKKLDDLRPYQRQLLNTPPRIASFLINTLNMKEKEKFLDPFCGSGTLLLFARDKLLEVYGCDLNKKCVNGSIENVDWINQKTRSSETIKHGDATKLNESFERNFFDGIACEPILLTPIRFQPNAEKVKENIEAIKPTYFNFLKSAYEVMKPGTRLCVVSPFVHTIKKDVFLELSNKARQIGFKTINLLTKEEAKLFNQHNNYLLDFNKDQKIRRMIYVFEK